MYNHYYGLSSGTTYSSLTNFLNKVGGIDYTVCIGKDKYGNLIYMGFLNGQQHIYFNVHKHISDMNLLKVIKIELF